MVVEKGDVGLLRVETISQFLHINFEIFFKNIKLLVSIFVRNIYNITFKYIHTKVLLQNTVKTYNHLKRNTRT